MTAGEIQERYRDMLAEGKLQEVLDLVMQQTDPQEIPVPEMFHAGRSIKTAMNEILSRRSSEEAEHFREMIDQAISVSTENPAEYERERLERQAASYNESVGYLNDVDGINCPLCKNKGYRERVVKNELFGYYSSTFFECECQRARKSWHRMQKSGLARLISEMTFENYQVSAPWQKYALECARAYLDGQGGIWFFIGGQAGSGKSHLCTAICGQFLQQGLSVRYMKWAEESIQLKSKVNDEDYGTLLDEFKKYDVLYIDDFLKVPRFGNSAPSVADIRLAFQILDYRYCNKLRTILSTEYLMDELLVFDEAVGSRIYQMSHGSMVQIQRGADRNYRWK